MTLRELALSQDIHPQTTYWWYRAGKMPVPTHRVGNKLVLVGDLESTQPKQGSTVIYARVSSSEQKSDLDRQAARVLIWATEIDKVVTEVGSALNGHRRKFLALLGDLDVTTILVEHRDRLCRFGANYVEAALGAQSGQLVVVDSAEIDDDLVRDVTELLTSLCARLYGRPLASNKAQKAIEAVCS
ncbi:IS607 family transposase [Ferrimicrobium acidiphilum]|uniref:IS607 family transposase n=1 Tax=Ferrimicrobium acidiphilum TaxID=121039 RepID=A0ABV3XYM6_9ACTN